MNFFNQPSPDQEREFNEVLRLYGTMAYRMALQLTKGKEDEARDLVQDAFIKIWKHWGTQQPGAFKGWMYRILHNLYMDAMRKRARHPAVSLDQSAGDADEGSWEQRLADPDATPADLTETAEVQVVVRSALHGLETEYRVAVVLCDMEGLSYEEIAQVTGVPIGTVRSRIHRGRQQLKSALRPFATGSKASKLAEAGEAAKASEDALDHLESKGTVNFS
jgi:RNA polymerase sigma-70 factor (ECF subfamily)